MDWIDMAQGRGQWGGSSEHGSETSGLVLVRGLLI
jgi:hypothetical protein